MAPQASSAPSYLSRDPRVISVAQTQVGWEGVRLPLSPAAQEFTWVSGAPCQEPEVD